MVDVTAGQLHGLIIDGEAFLSANVDLAPMATEQEVPIDDGPDGPGAGDGGGTAPPRFDSRFLDIYPGEQDGSPAALREEVEFWRHVFDSLVWNFPEYVFVVNDEGALTHINTENDNVDEELVDEMLGLQAADMFGTEEGGTLADEVVRAGETMQEDDVRAGTANDGSTYHVRAGATPITTPDGDVVGAFEVVNDVTELVEQRRTMEALQQQMAEEVNVIVDDLLELSERVSASSQQIGEIANDQAGNLDGLADEVEQMSATIEEIASSAEEVNRKSQEAERLAGESHGSAEETLDHVEEIADAGDLLTENTRTLSARVEEIDRIVTVIDDIADQTNLLALNASIEAARAGEAGGGFAVVADEVKALAEQSKQEAGEIEGIVEEITENIETTVGNVEEANDRIDAAVDQIETLMDNQREIIEAVSETSVGMDEIADATGEQSRSAEEVTSILSEAVSGVNQVSAEIQELAAANEQQVEKVAAVRESIEGIESHLDERTDD